jgi:hypothetical protein
VARDLELGQHDGRGDKVNHRRISTLKVLEHRGPA